MVTSLYLYIYMLKETNCSKIMQDCHVFLRPASRPVTSAVVGTSRNDT